MASPETNYPSRHAPQGYRSQPARSHATWYIVLGAIVLLVLAYFMTAGMVGPLDHVVTEPQNRVEGPADPIPAIPQEGAAGAPATPEPSVPAPAN